MIRPAIAFLSLAVPATAGDFSLQSPIACDLASDCHIQQYVDHDPGPGARDFTCQGQSYDAHKGTDFAIPDLARMAEGVPVRAAAPGVVLSLRDGMADTRYSEATAAATEGRECGNGLIIEHAGGWTTQYCHLRQGSLVVTPGQTVEAGTPLGAVGMSGQAQFPHLHLTLRHDGSVVDPFDPTGVIDCDTPEANTLWQKPLPYRPGGIISLGITPEMPSYDAVKAGALPRPGTEAPALVLYGYFFSTRAGDVIELSLTGPDGPVADQRIALDKPQAQLFRAVGRKRPRIGWSPGQYTGTARLMRGDNPVESRKITLDLP